MTTTWLTEAAYLPCPDTDDDGLKTEQVLAALWEGQIPWNDLGISRWDSWGNRIRYRVLPNFFQKRRRLYAGDGGT